MYQQDEFICMQSAFWDCQTAVLSALFENRGYVKHALWFGILTGSLWDIPGWGAQKSSGRNQTAPSFQFISCGSSGADVAAEMSRRGFDCTPRTTTLQSSPIKLFSTCYFSPRLASSPAVKRSRHRFECSTPIIFTPLQPSLLSKPTPVTHWQIYTKFEAPNREPSLYLPGH